MQVHDHCKSNSEYGLSKDVDVALWVQARKHQRLSQLIDTGNFVIVDSAMHAEFDEFKKTEHLVGDLSYIEKTDLIDLFLDSHVNIKSTAIFVAKFGLQYVYISNSKFDTLCEWIYEGQLSAVVSL